MKKIFILHGGNVARVGLAPEQWNDFSDYRTPARRTGLFYGDARCEEMIDDVNTFTCIHEVCFSAMFTNHNSKKHIFIENILIKI
jgi:hypothetical protein